MFARTILTLALLAVCVIPSVGQETAESVIKQAIKAMGYPTESKPYHLTWNEQGKLMIAGQTITYDAKWAFEPTSKYRFDMTADFQGQKISMLLVQNAGKAKETSMGQSQLLSGEKLEESIHSVYQLWVNTLTPLVTEKGFTLKLLGDKEHGGKPVTSVLVSREGQRDITLHFDKKTHLLAGCTDKVKDEFQGWKEVTQDTEFSDYVKGANGEMTFQTMNIKRDGQLILQSKLSNTKRIDGLNEQLFKVD